MDFCSILLPAFQCTLSNKYNPVKIKIPFYLQYRRSISLVLSLHNLFSYLFIDYKH